MKPVSSQAVFGGPDSQDSTAEPEEEADAALLASADPELNDEGGQDKNAGFLIVDGSAAQAAGNPFGIASKDSAELIHYTVEKGDTLSAIAKKFDIAVDMLFSANPSLRATIREGQDIIIFPGAIYTVKNGDTLASIAKAHKVEQKVVTDANDIGSVLSVGAKLLIPGGKSPISGRSGGSTGGSLPSYSGYFAIPMVGYNWGKLHGHNGVDIANACGTSVRSAAAGVVRQSGIGSWNGGYGGLVVIQHDNGTQTYYAHLSSSLVRVGQAVERGEVIAKSGNSGKVTGVTGCHLHFEVRGAKNPFSRY